MRDRPGRSSSSATSRALGTSFTSVTSTSCCGRGSSCDRLIVGVVTDEALFAAKDKWPIVPLDERFEMVRNLDLVDDVVIDHSSNKLEVWQRVGFDVLFKGDDWRGTAKGYKLEEDMASVGVRVKYFPYTAHTSSTMLRSILADR